MSIGLGVFLGCVFLGTVLLYVKTANSWNWRKIGKRVLIAIGGVIVIALLWSLGYLAYEKWEHRIQVVTSLKGISLGDKMADVVFKFGEFEKLENDSGAKQKYQDEERYKKKDELLTVTTRGGIVEAIFYICTEQYEYTSTNQIGCGDSGDKIKETFGSKTRILCSKRNEDGDQYKRVFDVVEYGTRYLVGRNKVAGFFVTSKKELESLVGLNWDACK